MKSLCAIVLTLAGIASAQAFTCGDVRVLSPAQQAYYINIYNIAPAQQKLIRQACSPAHRLHPADFRQAGASARQARANQ